MSPSSTVDLLSMPNIPGLPTSIPSISGFSFSGDLMSILLVFGVLIVLVFWQGRGALLSLLISLYVAMALYLHLPISLPGGGSLMQAFLIDAAVLFGFAGILYFFISQLVTPFELAEGVMKFIVPALLAISATGLIFAILINTLEIGRVYEFSFYIAKLFTPDLYFWWLIAPVVALAVAARN